MKIAIYFSPLGRTFKPTGVGRHTLGMAGQLGSMEGVEAALIAGRGAYRRAKPNLPEELASLPVQFLPGPEVMMRKALLYTPLVSLDRWAPSVDWVYCPKEQPVTVRKSRLAVTIHDVLPLEKEIPGYWRRLGLGYRLRWKWTLWRIVKRADLIATVSEFTKQRLLALFPEMDPSRVVVVGNGVGDVFFRKACFSDDEVLVKYGVESQKYVVVSGGLQVRKGADVVLKLSDEWKRKGTDLVILMTGRRHDSFYMPVVRELNRQGSSYPLRLVGYVPDEDLAVLLTHSICLIFPSVYEGFGIPAVEAMAAGTPVVFNPVAALPEVIGEAGIPVSANTPEEFDRIIHQIADHPELRERYIAVGRERAKHFTWLTCASRLVAALRST